MGAWLTLVVGTLVRTVHGPKRFSFDGCGNGSACFLVEVEDRADFCKVTRLGIWMMVVAKEMLRFSTMSMLQMILTVWKMGFRASHILMREWGLNNFLESQWWCKMLWEGVGVCSV